MDAFGAAMVSHARATQQAWPFVTMPDFAVRATKTKRLSKAAWVAVYSIVQGPQRAAYENYTAANHDWVRQSVEIQSVDPHYYGTNYLDYYTADYIHDYDEEPVVDRDFYMPVWQNAPCVSTQTKQFTGLACL